MLLVNIYILYYYYDYIFIRYFGQNKILEFIYHSYI